MRASIRSILAALAGAIGAPLLALFSSVAGAAGGGEAPEGPQGTALERWIEDLAHPLWGRREAAERRIEAAGAAAARLLEEAAGSSDPELAARARRLLDRIDPPVALFRAIRFEKEEQGPPIAVHTGERLAPPGVEVEIAGGGVVPGLKVVWDAAPGGGARMECREGPGGVLATAPPLVPAFGNSTASILFAGERRCYEAAGAEARRSRTRLLTLLSVRIARRSRIEEEGPRGRPQDAGARALAELLSQAASGSTEERAEALCALEFLRIEEAKEVFRQALSQPELFPLGALGLAALGDPEGLEALEAIAASPSPQGSPAARAGRGALPPPRLRALVYLAESGAPPAFEALSVELFASAHHSLAAAHLADALARGEAAANSAVLPLVLSERYLLGTSWQDPEKVHLLRTALEVAAARGAREALEQCARAFRQLARRGVGPESSLEAPQFPRLVEELARILSRWSAGFSADALLLEAVEGPPGRWSLEAALALARRHAGSRWPGGGFEAALRTITGVLKSEEVEGSLKHSALRGLLELSRTTSPREGLAAPIVEALLAACEEVSSGAAIARELREELAYWTGMDLTDLKDPELSARLEAWLEDEEAVARHERELARSRAEEPEKPVGYYRFLLVRRSGEHGVRYVPECGWYLSVVPGRSRPEPRPWIGGGTVLLERDRRTSGVFRVDGALRVPAGTFVIRRGGLSWRRELCFELGPLRPLPRRVSSGPAGTAYEVHLIVEDGAREDGAAAPPAGVLGEPAALWAWCAGRWFLADLEGTAAAERRRMVALARNLGLREAVPALRRALERYPEVETARALCELGDQAGLDFLRSRLDTNAPDRLDAATHLAELGRPEGALTLVRLLALDPDLRRRKAFRVYPALESFVRLADPQAPARDAVIDFVISHLDEPSYQHVAFRIIERVAGTDFGFSSARTRPSNAEARRAAVEEARRWWKRTRKSQERAPPATGQS